MNVAIRYFSRGGNTKKLADAISQEVGVEAKTVSNPLKEACDILFLLSSVYAADVDNRVKDFIQSLDPAKVKKVVNLSTSASGRTTDKKVKALLADKGIEMEEQSFHCSGSFLIVHRNHPDKKDIQKCREFVRNLIDRNL
ncbi:MAG: hypothetical protein J6D18_03175 [Erysipelotrichaceae bacterium]|nr:hypothetical protein [Erysipelotrichaceae bacterium]